MDFNGYLPPMASYSDDIKQIRWDIWRLMIVGRGTSLLGIIGRINALKRKRFFPHVLQCHFMQFDIIFLIEFGYDPQWD